MALKKKPVTGMKDMLPKEMEIRDYVIQMIKDTYKTCLLHRFSMCSTHGVSMEVNPNVL